MKTARGIINAWWPDKTADPNREDAVSVVDESIRDVELKYMREHPRRSCVDKDTYEARKAAYVHGWLKTIFTELMFDYAIEKMSNKN